MTQLKQPVPLTGQSFLKEIDFNGETLHQLIDFALTLKAYRRQGIQHHYLTGKYIALLFEKHSTRTRIAFTVGATELGAQTTFLGKEDLHLGKKESLKDTAKVLGSIFDGIEFRGYKQQDVEDLATYSGVPIWNGLTDDWHPTQMLADFMTLKEVFGSLQGLTLTYVGDGRNNIANSLLVSGALLGVTIKICTPKSLSPSPQVVALAQQVLNPALSSIEITEDIATAVRGADALYTDVWVSMGEEAEFEHRIHLLKDYQVNKDMLKMTGKETTIFLHCLPAFHDTQTQIGKEIYQQYGLTAMEVTDDVFNSPCSKVFEQAENRLHSIKAILASTLY